MASTTTFTCDRCSAEIRQDRHLINIESGRLRRRLHTLDLCSVCSSELEAWLGKPATATAARDDGATIDELA